MLLDHLEIVFENCEYLRVDRAGFISFYPEAWEHMVPGIHNEHYRITGGAQLILKNDAPANAPIIERIQQCPDIVFLELYSVDGLCTRVTMPWRDETAGGETNAMQQSRIEDDLFIVEWNAVDRSAS